MNLPRKSHILSLIVERYHIFIKMSTFSAKNRLWTGWKGANTDNLKNLDILSFHDKLLDEISNTKGCWGKPG